MISGKCRGKMMDGVCDRVGELNGGETVKKTRS